MTNTSGVLFCLRRHFKPSEITATHIYMHSFFGHVSCHPHYICPVDSSTFMHPGCCKSLYSPMHKLLLPSHIFPSHFPAAPISFTITFYIHVLPIPKHYLLLSWNSPLSLSPLHYLYPNSHWILWKDPIHAPHLIYLSFSLCPTNSLLILIFLYPPGVTNSSPIMTTIPVFLSYSNLFCGTDLLLSTKRPLSCNLLGTLLVLSNRHLCE